jgi:hypothetical protein
MTVALVRPPSSTSSTTVMFFQTMSLLFWTLAYRFPVSASSSRTLTRPVSIRDRRQKCPASAPNEA